MWLVYVQKFRKGQGDDRDCHTGLKTWPEFPPQDTPAGEGLDMVSHAHNPRAEEAETGIPGSWPTSIDDSMMHTHILSTREAEADVLL